MRRTAFQSSVWCVDVPRSWIESKITAAVDSCCRTEFAPMGGEDTRLGAPPRALVTSCPRARTPTLTLPFPFPPASTSQVWRCLGWARQGVLGGCQGAGCIHARGRQRAPILARVPQRIGPQRENGARNHTGDVQLPAQLRARGQQQSEERVPRRAPRLKLERRCLLHARWSDVDG